MRFASDRLFVAMIMSLPLPRGGGKRCGLFQLEPPSRNKDKNRDFNDPLHSVSSHLKHSCWSPTPCFCSWLRTSTRTLLPIGSTVRVGSTSPSCYSYPALPGILFRDRPRCLVPKLWHRGTCIKTCPIRRCQMVHAFSIEFQALYCIQCTY